MNEIDLDMIDNMDIPIDRSFAGTIWFWNT